jgi:hypothetical protein
MLLFMTNLKSTNKIKSFSQTSSQNTPQSQQLMISFYPSAQQVSRSLFTAKLPYSLPHYAELDIFRKHIREGKIGSLNQPYSSNKKPVRIYKSIFFALGFLFVILGMLILFKISIWSYAHLIGPNWLWKSFLSCSCGVLALAAFSIGLSMRIEREAVYYCARKAQEKLTKIYASKRIKLGFKRYFAYQQTVSFKQCYQEICDKIKEQKEEALLLVKQISVVTIDKQLKETLYNQAISDLNDKLDFLVHSFKHSSSKERP